MVASAWPPNCAAARRNRLLGHEKWGRAYWYYGATERYVLGPIRDEVDRRLLELLVCPLTKGPLRYDRAAQELISKQAGLAYPVRDGIPVMLESEARRLDDGAAPADH